MNYRPVKDYGLLIPSKDIITFSPDIPCHKKADTLDYFMDYEVYSFAHDFIEPPEIWNVNKKGYPREHLGKTYDLTLEPFIFFLNYKAISACDAIYTSRKELIKDLSKEWKDLCHSYSIEFPDDFDYKSNTVYCEGVIYN